jgi:SAM-dependent methyltransferase
MEIALRLYCFSCGAQGLFDSQVDSKFSGRTFEYLRCNICDVGWVVNPNIDFNIIYDKSYYEGFGSDLSLTYWEEAFPKNDYFYFRLRNIEYSGVYKTFNKLCLNLKTGNPSAHLDFGGGLGGLVRYLRNKGLDSNLFEEGFARETARQLGTPVIEHLLTDSFEIISAIEVFEHLVDPIDSIKLISKALKPGGFLLVTTGNLSKHKGLIADWYYAKNTPDVHVSFFSPNAMSNILSSLGLEKTDTKFHFEVILYKILKNVFMLPFIRNKLVIKKLIWNLRFVFVPFVPIIDRLFGVSELGLYQKVR